MRFAFTNTRGRAAGAGDADTCEPQQSRWNTSASGHASTRSVGSRAYDSTCTLVAAPGVRTLAVYRWSGMNTRRGSSVRRSLMPIVRPRRLTRRTGEHCSRVGLVDDLPLPSSVESSKPQGCGSWTVAAGESSALRTCSFLPCRARHGSLDHPVSIPGQRYSSHLAR